MKIACDGCGKEFDRKQGEINRSLRLGRKQYCSLSCSGRNTPLVTRPSDFPRSVRHLTPGNRLDEFSPFRHHLSRLKQRKHEIDVTVEDLKRLWDEQDGICPLTGWQLHIEPSSKWNGNRCTPKSASLDRIDSSKGYLPDNIRWISVMANYAKGGWTDQDVIEFACAVASIYG